ncbi:hypothetical protein PACTADRAFT_48721 [Pachysolen tannophilus NRRL Y-2460]|uniref:Ferroxidase n=1 Tax=Pachysolen tannophilus NRRL Y-2460 TaxID=669874 RepID=A0A1E4TYW6_PACTA|nr:hypothetical protein PACTADRAFT_48721 [Pachysolen tannophilus NRRL Y-2460]
MLFKRLLTVLGAAVGFAAAETHTLYWNATWADANPDGYFERPVVSCNGTFPWPQVHINKGDTVLLYLTNGLGDHNTTVHFHGIFQHNSNEMDGPEMVNQCPIPDGETMLYNFTITDQAGAYWYHSHTRGQYADGFRGAFIIHDTDEEPFTYDEEVSVTIAEWYHDLSDPLIATFLNLYNPTGAEPIPQTLLFNDSYNCTWDVQPNTTYKLNIISTGFFVSQYFWIEDHNMTVVQIDGINVTPNTTDLLYITAAQRYTVLITTKDDTSQNYAIMQKMDEDMLDNEDTVISLNNTSTMSYDSSNGAVEQSYIDSYDSMMDDFYLEPVDAIEIYDDYDYLITIDVIMTNLDNGINYAFFNNITYTSPKVPTLTTVFTAGEEATNQIVYGTNTHAYVLQKDEIVQIVVNNQDTGKHPFHLHGHVFQVLERHESISDDDSPVGYNESDHAEWPQYPMRRDTFYVKPQSYFVIRFKADNPGVWFFHCHIEWHLIQGLAITLIEDPLSIQANQSLSDSYLSACEAAGVPTAGNAAGNTEDYLDLTGQNVQCKDLPAGFTARGIVALVFSCITGIVGCVVIGIYGMAEVHGIEKLVVEDLNVSVNDNDDNEDTGSQSVYDVEVAHTGDVDGETGSASGNSSSARKV